MIKRFSASSIRNGQRTNKLWDQVSFDGDFQSIATVTVGAGGQSTIDFPSIPQGYSHLQLRGVLKGTGGVTYSRIYFNGDTGANYSWHEFYYNGVLGAGNATNQSFGLFADPISASSETNIFSGFVTDILDYTDTNKNKTVKTLVGYETNSTGYAYVTSTNWRSTNAITSISINLASGNFAQHSKISLYGIR